MAADVRYYGKWMRDEAERRLGHLYPKVTLPKEQGGGEATVIAWLWARTVTCPNPACGAEMPLASKWWLSTKKGKEAWVEPVVDRAARTVRFEVRYGGRAPEGTKQRGKSRCLFCGTNNISDATLRAQAMQHKMGSVLLAVVAEGRRGRVYLGTNGVPTITVEPPATDWLRLPMPDNPRWFSPPGYGLPSFADLFTPRQQVALTTFSDLVGEARQRVLADARRAGLPDDGVPLNDGGTGAQAYADAVATYLAFAVDKLADRNAALCSWDSGKEHSRNTFGRQAIPMVWDFAENNPFSESSGNWSACVEWTWKVLERLAHGQPGRVKQLNAVESVNGVLMPVISTDPPYYDNIGYADLSDFFYVWLRRSLGAMFPDLLGDRLTPKEEELIATPYRHDGSKAEAQKFFEAGLSHVFANIRARQHPDYPLTVYYAFKQAESDEEEDDGNGNGGAAVASTGWETMLEALRAEFTIDGTWPMRSELLNRPVASGTNALASSIVLVCRPRPEDAQRIPRRQFIMELKAELPAALRKLQHGNIAPVDLAQAAIGPGMAVFSRYAAVLEADGKPMRVRTALQLINQTLDEVLAEQEGELDADTRWAVAWYQQNGMAERPYGTAETLSKAMNTSVEGLRDEAKIVYARAGVVRLLGRDELPEGWDPRRDPRPGVWKAAQYLIKALDQGEEPAARLLAQLRDEGERARDLAYRLYTISERKGWAQEAFAYNSLVRAWPVLVARQIDYRLPEQTRMSI